MNNKKYFAKAILILFLCILINCAGKQIAKILNLPLWLDSFGTVACAFFLGPLWGALAGFSVNLIYGIFDNVSLVYGLTSIAVGITVGVLSKKNRLNSLFSASSIAVTITFVSIIISVPLNCIFYNGMTGNLWGDGVIDFLREQNLPEFICVVAGEFYIDFLDKILTLLCFYFALNLLRAKKTFSGGR